MKVKCLPKGLPRNWQSHPKMPTLDGEFDIPMGTLFAKLLIFRTPRDLRKCWKDVVCSPFGKGRTLGAVNGLFHEVYSGKTGKSYLSVDPRYFCAIGLTRNNLSMEVIAHESVHAAFCFVKRKTRAPWAMLAKENDEEEVAYPAGRIARAINCALWKHNLYG